MDDSSSVPKVKFRRNFDNLPKQEHGNRKKRKKEEDGEETQQPESPKKGPPAPDRASTIDITA